MLSCRSRCIPYGSDYPWRDLNEDWYAALESGGIVYGLARSVRRSSGSAYEYLDRETGAWRPSSRLAAEFTGAGGVTDAIPITSTLAAEVERALIEGRPVRATQEQEPRRGKVVLRDAPQNDIGCDWFDPRRNGAVRNLDDAFEKLLLAVARRASERGILLLALVLYGGIGLALPVVAGWSLPWLIGANMVGATFAFVFLAMWLAVQVQASRRRNLLEWTTDLRRLNAEEFEWLVGEVYRRDGWNVEETGHQDGPDGGIDLVLRKGRDRLIVQCKRWQSWSVGVEDVRAFAGALAREGLPTRAGIFVTLSDFTEYARSEAKQLGLTLIDKVDLYAKVEKVRRPEPCPNCESPMLLDRSPRGWWFRCVANGCGGKKDLGGDPGQAIDLLTQPPG